MFPTKIGLFNFPDPGAFKSTFFFCLVDGYANGWHSVAGIFHTIIFGF